MGQPNDRLDATPRIGAFTPPANEANAVDLNAQRRIEAGKAYVRIRQSQPKLDASVTTEPSTAFEIPAADAEPTSPTASADLLEDTDPLPRRLPRIRGQRLARLALQEPIHTPQHPTTDTSMGFPDHFTDDRMAGQA